MDAGDPLEQSAQWFLRVRSESTSVEALAEFRRWLEQDPRNAQAYQQVSATWNVVGEKASSPEVMTLMHEVRADVRAGSQSAVTRPALHPQRRTSLSKAGFMGLAAMLIIAVVGGLTWFGLGKGEVYATQRGERRVLTLQDGSVVTLDALSRIKVAYRADERRIALEQGQARFDVAANAARPFRVTAAHRTVMALGTQFNVELVGDRVLVTTIEGRIRVSVAEPGISTAHSEAHTIIELKAGEGLDASNAGSASVLPHVDIERATAWQQGKVIFDEEPLAQAAERINRYGHVRIEVDPAIATLGVNGVFNAGDSAAFVDAVSSYFPVSVERISATELRLRAKR